MSRSGPMRTSISVVKRRVRLSSAPWLAQYATETRVQAESFGGKVELMLGHLPGIDGRGCAFGGHRGSRSSSGERRASEWSAGWLATGVKRAECTPRRVAGGHPKE